MNKKLSIIFAVFGLISLGLSLFPANAAGGTNGNLDLGVSSIANGGSLAIRCFNLDVSSDYGIVINAVVFANFTTSSTQTSRVFYTLAAESGTTNLMTVLLTDSAATTIETVEVAIYEPTDIVPQALLIAIIVVGVIVYFLINMLKGMKNKA